MIRWAWILVCLLGVGPVIGRIVSTHLAIDGSHDASLLAGGSLVGGIVLFAVVAIIAVIASGIGAKLVDATTGCVAAAAIFGWAAWNTGSVDDVLSLTGSGALWKLAVEGALIGIVMLAVVAVAAKCQRPFDLPRTPTAAHPILPGEFGTIANVKERVAESPSSIGIAASAALLLGAVNAYIFSANFLHGQSVAAAALAAIFGVTVARVLVPKCPVLVPVLGLGILVCMSFVVAAIMHGSNLTAALAEGSYLRLARPSPLEWATGLCLGIPMGRSLGDSFTAKNAAHSASHARA